MRETHIPKHACCIMDAEPETGFHSYLRVWPLLLSMTFAFILLSQLDSCPPHGSWLILSWLSVWTGWKAIHSDRHQQAAVTPPAPLPLLLFPSPSLGSDLWASSSSSSIWEESLFSSFFFFLVEMSLGSCPPALKKTLPALLLSSVLLHCLIFHPSSLFVWNVLQQHHQLAPLLRKDLDVI